MAIFNEILNARFARMSQKLFSMKGAAPVKQLAGELMVVLPIFHGAEDRYLEGWQRFGIQVQQNGLAAVNTGFRFRNPTTSNAVAVIEKLLYSNFTATPDDGQLLLAPSTTDLANAVATTLARFDPRGNPQPVCILSSATGPASLGGGSAKAAWVANATSNYDVIGTDIQEFPVLPGDALQVQTIAVNIQLNVSIWWRERPLEDSERA